MSKIERHVHQVRFVRLATRKPTVEFLISMAPLFSEKTIAELLKYIRATRHVDNKNAAYPDQE